MLAKYLIVCLFLKWQVNLLLLKWMKELEKIFYGNVVAYDAALLPEAKKDELQTVIWRYNFITDSILCWFNN